MMAEHSLITDFLEGCFRCGCGFRPETNERDRHGEIGIRDHYRSLGATALPPLSNAITDYDRGFEAGAASRDAECQKTHIMNVPELVERARLKEREAIVQVLMNMPWFSERAKLVAAIRARTQREGETK